jgi:VWFA-related protein
MCRRRSSVIIIVIIIQAAIIGAGIAGFLVPYCCATTSGGGPGQQIAAVPQKQKSERFGSSLDRLKWDQRNNRAIEKEPKREAKADEDVVKLSSLLVVVNALVTDGGGRPVSGLAKDDFSIEEDGRPQEVAVFSRSDQDTVPRKIILIIDRSGSERAYLESSLQAAKKLVDDLRSQDQMAIITDDVELVVSFTADKTRLKGSLDRLGGQGTGRGSGSAGGSRTAVFHSRSLQFSALFAALRELVKDDGSRHIIILQSDGDEAPTLRDQPDAGDYVWNMPLRNFGLADIIAAAERSTAMIYTIIPSERLLGLSPEELLEHGRQMLDRMERARFGSEREYQNYTSTHPMSAAKVKLFAGRFAAGQDAARRFAELTGGWSSYLERPDQAESIYSDILSDINHRYVLGYYPSDTPAADTPAEIRKGKNVPARPRHLKITVRSHPEYMVRARDSYLPPG